MFEERLQHTPLVSNGYSLKAGQVGRLTPSLSSQRVEDLWEQFQTQGYLWLKGLLNRGEVRSFRRRFFAAFQNGGLIAPASDPEEGIYDPAQEDRSAVNRRLTEMVRWASYEAFCLSLPILNFFSQALKGEIYLHKQKLIRISRPGDPNCIGAHYDLTYFRAGTDRVYTTWIPLGDVPAEMGGLIYLEGSDAWGRKMEAEFTALNMNLPPEERISAYNKSMSGIGGLTKDLPSLAERLNSRWLCADYEAGDVVIHSAYIIHASTENQSPENRIHLSTDIRYQRVVDEIDTRWSSDWLPADKL